MEDFRSEQEKEKDFQQLMKDSVNSVVAPAAVQADVQADVPDDVPADVPVDVPADFTVDVPVVELDDDVLQVEVIEYAPSVDSESEKENETTNDQSFATNDQSFATSSSIKKKVFDATSKIVNLNNLNCITPLTTKIRKSIYT